MFETPLFHAPKHDTGIIHIIRMSHSKILNDFPTSTWPQSSIKTVPGASFFNPEQTCQNGEKIWEQDLICHTYVVNLHSNFHLQSKGRNVERSQLFFTIFHPVVALCFLVAVATLEKHSLVGLLCRARQACYLHTWNIPWLEVRRSKNVTRIWKSW